MVRRGALAAASVAAISAIVLSGLIVWSPDQGWPARVAWCVGLGATGIAAALGVVAERRRRIRLLNRRRTMKAGPSVPRRPSPTPTTTQTTRRLDRTVERLEQTRERLRETRRTMQAWEDDRARRARRRIDRAIAAGRLDRSPEHPLDRVDLATDWIDAGWAGYARDLLEDPEVRAGVSTHGLRSACGQLLTVGYHRTATAVAAEVVGRDGAAEADERRLQQCRATAAMYDWRPPVDDLLRYRACFDPRGPVVHVVSKAAPRVEAGYTLRTQHLTTAQRRAGLRPVIAVQVGGEGRPVPEREDEELDGVPIHRLAGPERGSVGWDEWMEHNVRGLVELVEELRPSVLHAHSDFIQALVAQEASRYSGVPTVYEVRGFWEETGRTSVMQRLPHLDLDDLYATIGEPESYTGRRDQESRARRGAGAVLTLARVMARHIESIDKDDRTPVLVPNAVDVELFRPTDGGDVRRRLGFEPDDHVFGYISSITAYEGVDTLIRAYASVVGRGDVGRRPRLLVVGDGKALPAMRTLTARLGLTDVVFTGRVRHEEIIQHYAAIDTFVVPRHPTPVTELVTPLKPFEALATGKRLVMSDVAALREIAEDCGTAALFPAGESEGLAEIMLSETKVPTSHLVDLRGREWVAQHRTWAANAEVTGEVYERLIAARADSSRR